MTDPASAPATAATPATSTATATAHPGMVRLHPQVPDHMLGPLSRPHEVWSDYGSKCATTHAQIALPLPPRRHISMEPGRRIQYRLWVNYADDGCDGGDG